MARAVLVYSFYHRTSLAIQHPLTATTERMILREDRVVKGHLRVIIYVGIWSDPPIVKQPVSLMLSSLKCDMLFATAEHVRCPIFSDNCTASWLVLHLLTLI